MAVQDKESRILIPFSYQEFTQDYDRNLITARLKDFFYDRDLFAFESPLRSDNYFFGRSQTIQALYGKYKSGENGSLFGLRRIGKTSVLLAVQRHLKLRSEPAVFIDCSEPAFHRKRWNEALHFIVTQFLNAFSLTEKVQVHSAEEYDDKNASHCFEMDLKSIYKRVGEKRLLIIFDEIENITFEISPSDHWREDKDYIFFWQSIRSVFQKNSHLFNFIIAGVNPKAVETTTVQGYDNPIYRFVTPTYLGFFDVPQVREMVSSIGNYMGLSFEDEVFTYLTDDYGGHPFLIRQVCSLIHKRTNDPRPCVVTKFHYQESRQNLEQYIQDYIGLIVSILKERYKIEYELLEYLAQDDQKTFNEFAQLSHTLIEHLEGYGLIQKVGEKYHFKIKAVESFIKQRTTISNVLATKEDRWKEITTRRNKFETDLRKIVKMTLKFHFGSTEGRNKFLEIVGRQNQKAKLLALNFDEMFTSEIYFDDLRKVINKNWNIFGRIFNNDKQHFDTYMEYVNKNRIDAHAKEIDESSYGLVLISIEWLQKHVDNFLE